MMKYLKLLIPPIIVVLINRLRKRRKKLEKELLKINSRLINSFSQHQEDLIIDAILNKSHGYYVDVGANDPDHFSNTKRFYLKGWCGINIEPQVPQINELNRLRPRDINLNFGIGDDEGSLDFYELDISTLSSFDLRTVTRSCERFGAKIQNIIPVPIKRLDKVLEENLPKDTEIDFLSIDTEGFDFKVLKSNDWKKFRPKLILIEYGKDFVQISNLLTEKKYEIIYKNSANLIFYRVDIIF